MHGPNHLFCAGCNMEDDALAAAAWAGILSASKHADAEKWAQTARELYGRPIIGSVSGLHLRCIGEDPTVEDIDMMIEMLKLSRDMYKRRADRKREKEAAQIVTGEMFVQ